MVGSMFDRMECHGKNSIHSTFLFVGAILENLTFWRLAIIPITVEILLSRIRLILNSHSRLVACAMRVGKQHSQERRINGTKGWRRFRDVFSSFSHLSTVLILVTKGADRMNKFEGNTRVDNRIE